METDRREKRKAEQGNHKSEHERNKPRQETEGGESQQAARNKPLTEEEIQRFIDQMPSGTQKRKKASKEEQQKERQKKLATQHKVCGKDKGDQKREEKKGRQYVADENMYLTEDQIQEFIKNMGKEGEEEQKEERKDEDVGAHKEGKRENNYTQVGGSSSSGGTDKTAGREQEKGDSQTNIGKRKSVECYDIHTDSEEQPEQTRKGEQRVTDEKQKRKKRTEQER